MTERRRRDAATLVAQGPGAVGLSEDDVDYGRGADAAQPEQALVVVVADPATVARRLGDDAAVQHGIAGRDATAAEHRQRRSDRRDRARAADQRERVRLEVRRALEDVA